MTKTKITFCQLLSRKSYSPLRSNAAAAAVCTVQQHSHARAALQRALLCSKRRTSVAATAVTLQPFFEKRSFIEVKRDEKMQEKKLNSPFSHCNLDTGYLLEPVCCKKRQKSPNQETGNTRIGDLLRLFI